MLNQHQLLSPCVGGKLAGFLVAICLLAGCEEKVQTSVSGTVTNDGKPVTQGDVSFFKPATGEVAQGPLGEGGAYTLFMGEKALSPGRYKVMVTPTQTYEPYEGPGGPDKRLVEVGRENIPEVFSNRAKTPLEATIELGPNVVDFELSK